MRHSDLLLSCVLAFTTCALSGCGHHATESAAPLQSIDAGSNDAPPTETPDADAQGFLIDMFDDFEDGNRDILPSGGRYGHWWNYGDDSEGTNSVAVVALDPATERHTTYDKLSTMALRVQASGYTIWGSGFSSTVFAGNAYDVSAYAGLVLWARSRTSTPAQIRVDISDVNSDPAGGICDMTMGAPMEKACYDSHGQDLDLTAEWQRYHLPFWALRQLGFGLPVPTGLDTHKIYQIVFISHAGVTYDYDIDDIAFYRE